MSLYSRRGVSAQKEDVHTATEKLDKGLYPNAFCKTYPDYLAGDDAWVNLMHADGAGTKSVLAYLYWKETGDISVWRGIAQDAIAMNLDDLLCVGAYDNILFSSTIDRNKKLIPGEVLNEIITGSRMFFDMLLNHGINIQYLGGETADVGDVVRTISVNGTMAARWPKNRLITNEKIQAGDVIIGLASFGQSTYETSYNSGIGSNGLTSARHDMLHKDYALNYPETFETSLDNDVVYIGSHQITDKIAFEQAGLGAAAGQTTVGDLLLSPTRTYAPLIKTLLEECFEQIHGLVHCSGGGQTKCMKYIPGNLKIIKDNLFEPPLVFQLIQQSSGSDNREMYQVFNMGHRIEIFTGENSVASFIDKAQVYNIKAQVIGRVEAADNKQLSIVLKDERIIY